MLSLKNLNPFRNNKHSQKYHSFIMAYMGNPSDAKSEKVTIIIIKPCIVLASPSLMVTLTRMF